MFLPASRGFDRYVGIPYSADMGDARASPCTAAASGRTIRGAHYASPQQSVGIAATVPVDPAANYLPLIEQRAGAAGWRTSRPNTTVLEQPLDFSTLGPKYNDAILDFVATNRHVPFLLYVPFSHVHAARPSQPQEQVRASKTPSPTSPVHLGT
jgi:hypothetical protein